MKEQAPEERVKNFAEVSLGYSGEEAMKEAKRCLQCDAPMCKEGCPVGIDIPKFVRETAGGRFDEALKTLKDTNNLPAICGRVCPPGVPVREEMYPGHEVEPSGDRAAGALYR